MTYNVFSGMLNPTQSISSARAVGGMVQEKGSRDRCYSSRNVLHTQCASALSSEFPLFQGNAEALER